MTRNPTRVAARVNRPDVLSGTLMPNKPHFKINDLAGQACYVPWTCEHVLRGNAMRRLVVLVMVLVVAGCQSTTTDRNEKPKECDPRTVESGLCVPGEYEEY